MLGACYVRKKSYWIELFDRPIVFDELSRFRLLASLCRYSRRWCWDGPKRKREREREGEETKEMTRAMSSSQAVWEKFEEKRTVDIDMKSIRVSRDTSSCRVASASLSTSYGIIMSLFIRGQFLERIRRNGASTSVPSRSFIVMKRNEVSSTSRWPTIESCNSKHQVFQFGPLNVSRRKYALLSTIPILLREKVFSSPLAAWDKRLWRLSMYVLEREQQMTLDFIRAFISRVRSFGYIILSRLLLFA